MFEPELERKLPIEKLKNAKILITGANGMIASALTETIVELSDEYKLHTEVYVLCRNKAKCEERFRKFTNRSDFFMIIQDVSKPLSVQIDFNFIIHAASSAHPDAFNNTPVDVMKANFLGTLNLLEYSKNCTNCRFLFVSSSEVYGENEAGIEIFKEDTPGNVNFTRFRACYPESKRAAETLCFCFKKQYDVDIVIVRPAFIYGRDIIDSNTRADVYFLRQALNKQDIVMYSEGTQVRSYCYIKDCVSGILFSLLKGESGEVYNIGNADCVVTMREYAQKMA